MSELSSKKVSLLDAGLQNVTLFLIYLASAQAGVAVASNVGFAALVWPPAAIALAGMVLTDGRVWPAVLTAAFFFNYLRHGMPVAAAGIAVGNLLEATFGARLLHLCSFRPNLGRVRDVLALVAITVAFTTPLGATLGIASLFVTGALPSTEVLRTWLSWWAGDAVSCVLLAPVLLVWNHCPGWPRHGRRLIEGGALAAVTTALSLVVYFVWTHNTPPPLRLFITYLPVPVLVWAALRFGQFGTTATLVVFATIGTLGVAAGAGPLREAGVVSKLVYLQGAVCLAALTTIVLAAAVTEQRKALASVRNSKQRLHKAVAEFRAFFDLSGAGHVLVDPATKRYLRANRKFCDMVGYSEAELSRLTIMELTHPGDREQDLAEFLRLQHGGACEIAMETRCLRKDGVSIWVHIAATMIYDDCDAPLQVIGVVQDINERRRAEASLLTAKEAAEAANRAKSVFLANVSHEIRTPLGAMLGFTDFLLDPQQTPEDRHKCVTTIKRNGELLARIIDDVLDLSKVEADRLDIETLRFSLPDLIEEVISLLSFKAQDKGITMMVRADGPIPNFLTSDPTRLRQILLNVIGNAVKFAERGRVEVSMRMRHNHAGNSNTLEFLVKDTGPGLTPEQASRLFQPFSQADSSMARRYGGTGLGLFLSKKLAKALGGDLVLLETNPGEGCVFAISITAAGVESLVSFQRPAVVTTAAAVLQVITGDYKPLRHTRILLVEDSPDNQLLISRIVDRAGAEVDLAADGWEGITKASEGEYDLVLMDIQMPGIDGYEATRTLRARGFDKPIIALTAHAMKDERERALSHGFDDYLTKPIKRDHLISSISRLAAKVH